MSYIRPPRKGGGRSPTEAKGGFTGGFAPNKGNRRFPTVNIYNNINISYINEK